MRIPKFLLALLCFVVFISCQKEYSLEQGLSEGTLSNDGAGSCLPSIVLGDYQKDVVLNSSNYIELQINLTETGAYNISSDTVNGYSFQGSGRIDALGLHTVRINGSGKPLAEGINTFSVTYGSSTCLIDVTVISLGPSGTYTLNGAGSTCTGATVAGVYSVGVPTTAINSATIGVNVTTPGSYNISTDPVNGVTFSGSGNFTTTGAQTVVLSASGTPLAAGDHNYAASANAGSCTFSVTVAGGAAPAAFTLGGAGSTCTGFVSAGTYAAGAALTSANTVTINVNVTTPGAYTISTTAANGVTFSKIGVFTTTGAQTVTLTGTGTPTASGAINHTVNGTPGTCTFSITYTGAPAGNAVFTTSGAPAACTVATPAGTYTSGTVLDASNTVTVQVNVTTLGTYNLITNTVNGVTFAKSGSFTTLGLQNVVLQGAGTPIASGSHTYIVGTNGCTFSIAFTGTGPSNIFTAKFNNVLFNFSIDSHGYYYTPLTDVAVEGYVNTTTDEGFWINVDKETAPGPRTPVTAGTYTNQANASLYTLLVEYLDASNMIWAPRTAAAGTPDPFTVTITSITATRIVGTFTGTLRNEEGTGTLTKTVTEGVFNLPIN